MSDKSYTGTCFCGAVEVKVTGDAAGMGFCHCASCRSWSAGPINAFTLWKKDAVEVTKGKDKLRSFAKTPRSNRMWCDTCGGHVMTDHPQWGLVDVYAATIPGYDFKPGVHVHYQETVLPMRDGLPKQKDIPTEMGGTGELIAE
ncbi:MAG TPA: GFA family protein [Kofleriaceae bacterium]|nr:GFA family protein [Kofleriaceae bacterium]